MVAVKQQTVMVMRLINRFEEGMPPVAGGMLDQASWFLEAADFAASERAQWDREAK